MILLGSNLGAEYLAKEAFSTLKRTIGGIRSFYNYHEVQNYCGKLKKQCLSMNIKGRSFRNVVKGPSNTDNF